jgi:hypothetical protein
MMKQQNDMISGSKRSIDRYALVTRHNPVLHKADIFSPLSVGNGEFAFTADVTGLQTFPHEYRHGQPLCTQSQWGWHTNPKPTGMFFEDYRLDEYDTLHGRQGFPLHAQGQEALYTYLRQNPHRLHLGRIGLRMTKRDSGKVLFIKPWACGRPSSLAIFQSRERQWSCEPPVIPIVTGSLFQFNPL